MAYLFDTGIFAANDSSGASLSGAKLTFYDNGTTTLKNTYPTKADAEAGTNANANPVVADANGRWGAIWLDDTFYTVKFQPSDGSFTRTRDDIGGTLADLVSTASGKGAWLVKWIQTGASAVARWVGDKLRENISPEDFGAVGDGVTDDAAAFTACITSGLTRKKKIRLTSATYLIGSRITVTMPNAAVGVQANNYFAQLCIRGEGHANSIINCPSSGFLKIVGSSIQHSVDLRDFAVTTGANGTYTAIEMDNSAYPFWGEWTTKSRIELQFRGNDGVNNVHHWQWCVDAIDWSNIDFSHSTFYGASTPAGGGVKTRASAGTYVCVFDFVGCHFRYLATGYEYGTGSQTANLDSCFFAMCTKSVYATVGGTNHQGLSITNCENYELGTGDGVHIACDVPNFVFSGNRLAVSASSVGVLMDITNQTNITNNQFFPDVTANTATAAISIDGTISGSHCIIANNNFASVTLGARLKSGSANVRFDTSNKWTTNMTGITDAGTNNVYGLGYAPGWGGSGTQLTSKSTAVTLNTVCGQITTHNASLAANTEVAFTVTNNSVIASDMIHVVVNDGNYQVRATDYAAGSFIIRLKNLSGGPLTDAVVIKYAIIRAASS